MPLVPVGPAMSAVVCRVIGKRGSDRTTCRLCVWSCVASALVGALLPACSEGRAPWLLDGALLEWVALLRAISTSICASISARRILAIRSWACCAAIAFSRSMVARCALSSAMRSSVPVPDGAFEGVPRPSPSGKGKLDEETGKSTCALPWSDCDCFGLWVPYGTVDDDWGVLGGCP